MIRRMMPPLMDDAATDGDGFFAQLQKAENGFAGIEEEDENGQGNEQLAGNNHPLAFGVGVLEYGQHGRNVAQGIDEEEQHGSGRQ